MKVFKTVFAQSLEDLSDCVSHTKDNRVIYLLDDSKVATFEEQLDILEIPDEDVERMSASRALSLVYSEAYTE